MCTKNRMRSNLTKHNSEQFIKNLEPDFSGQFFGGIPLTKSSPFGVTVPGGWEWSLLPLPIVNCIMGSGSTYTKLFKSHEFH